MGKSNVFLEACQNCKNSCCTFGGCEFSEKEMQKVLDAGIKGFFRKVEKNHYELITKDGVCPYLNKDMSCGIQDFKSLMGLAWPVMPKLEKGKKVLYLAECPLVPLLSEEEIGKCKEEAKKIDLEVCTGNTRCDKKELDLINERALKYKQKRLK